MATTVTVTERVRANHGSMKIATGKFTEVDDDIILDTGLRRIVHFKLRYVGAGGGDISASVYHNSKTASDTEDDPGFVFIPDDDLAALDDYAFEAFGK